MAWGSFPSIFLEQLQLSSILGNRNDHIIVTFSEQSTMGKLPVLFPAVKSDLAFKIMINFIPLINTINRCSSTN